MNRNIFYSFIVLSFFIILLVSTNKTQAAKDDTDIQAPDLGDTVLDRSYLASMGAFEKYFRTWVTRKYMYHVEFSALSDYDLELLSIPCDHGDRDCLHMKSISLANLSATLESLECFHAYICLRILDVLAAETSHSGNGPDVVLRHETVRDYAVRMISFFIYGKYTVNQWQLYFAMRMIEMARLDIPSSSSSDRVVGWMENWNDPSLLAAMNDFCEHCKKHNPFLVSLTGFLSAKKKSAGVHEIVIPCIRKMFVITHVKSALNMFKTSHRLIKKAHKQDVQLDPDFEEKKQKILDSIKLSKSEIDDYERKTVGGTESDLRRKNLGKRLQACQFYRACKLQPTTVNDRFLRKALRTGVVNRKKNDPIDETNETENSSQGINTYGKDNEGEAIREFEMKANVRVEPCGVFVDEHLNFLAARPDGLIGTDGIIEVKCPIIAKHMDPVEAIAGNVIKYLHFNNNGELILKRPNEVFYQIQGSLHITQRQYCYLIIRTEKGMVFTTIMRDDNFWKEQMEEELIEFYENRMLPEIIKSQS